MISTGRLKCIPPAQRAGMSVRASFRYIFLRAVPFFPLDWFACEMKYPLEFIIHILLLVLSLLQMLIFICLFTLLILFFISLSLALLLFHYFFFYKMVSNLTAIKLQFYHTQRPCVICANFSQRRQFSLAIFLPFFLKSRLHCVVTFVLARLKGNNTGNLCIYRFYNYFRTKKREAPPGLRSAPLFLYNRLLTRWLMLLSLCAAHKQNGRLLIWPIVSLQVLPPLSRLQAPHSPHPVPLTHLLSIAVQRRVLYKLYLKDIAKPNNSFERMPQIIAGLAPPRALSGSLKEQESRVLRKWQQDVGGGRSSWYLS